MRATVLRDAVAREIDASQLVRGDIVVLASGDRVPADLRLCEAQGLEVDVSMLTGESVPVAHDAALVCEENAPVADRTNSAFAGTLVVRGRAKGVVVATGSATEVGRIASGMTGTAAGKPPLTVRMERFSHASGDHRPVGRGVDRLFRSARPRPADLHDVHLRRGARRVRHSRGSAGGRSHRAGDRRAADGEPRRHRAPVARRRRARQLFARRQRQDRDAHLQRAHRGRVAAGRRYSLAGDRRGLPAGRRDQASRWRPRWTNRRWSPQCTLRRLATKRSCKPPTVHGGREVIHPDLALLVLAAKAGIGRDHVIAQWPVVAQIAYEPERRFAA